MTVPWILLSLAALCIAYLLLFVYPTTSRKVWFTERQLAEWTDRTLAQRALHDILVLKAIGALNFHGWDPQENAERYE